MSKTRTQNVIWRAFGVFWAIEEMKIRAWAEKQAYFRWKCKPFYGGYVERH